MAIPDTPLEISVELKIDGVWTDVTSYVRRSRGISIYRGRAEENKDTDPAQMTLTFDAKSTNYYLNGKVPTSVNYGKIGRNTEIRCSVKAGQPRLRLSGGDSFYTADSAALSITGDIDLRADVVLPTWRPAAISYIGGPVKSNSYAVWIDTGGLLVMAWWSGAVLKTATSTAPVPGPLVGRKSVRATLDVNNGAGGWTATFYYSDDDTMNGTWVQFGDAVTGAGVTSIDDTTDSLATLVTSDVTPCEVNEIRVYQGIGGTLRASPKFTAQTSGVTSFADAQGNTWQASGSARLDNRHYRFWGECSSWSVHREGRTSASVVADVVAAGVQRRLGQGTAVRSTLTRSIPRDNGAELRGYWPLEDGPDARQLETIGTASPPGTIGAGATGVRPGAATGFLATSQAPTVGRGRMVFRVAPYANTNEFMVRFLMRLGSTRPANNAVLMRIKTNSSLGWVDWVYRTSDGFQFLTYTNLGVLSMTGTNWSYGSVIGSEDGYWSLEFKKNGTGVDCKVVARRVTAVYGQVGTDTNASITLGSCTQVIINPDGADLGELAIGQLHVASAITNLTDGFNAFTDSAYAGEEAHERIARLADESDFSAVIAGRSATSIHMGTQERSTMLDVLRSASRADGGELFDSRDELGIEYRLREELHNQTATLSLAYTDGNLQMFDPAEDDLATINRLSVTRVGGATATVENTTGRLGTSAVGIYDDSASLSLYADDQAKHAAGWRLNVGGVDEERYPQLAVNLAHPDFTGNDVLMRQALTVDCGDRLDVTDLPESDDARQIVQGYSEYLSNYEHAITFNLTPASPYRAATFLPSATAYSDPSRFSNENTTVNGSHNSSTTSLSVKFSYGPIWTHADGDFDIMVNGERMTVTGVTGSSSPQTLTVTRSVNSVSKSHSDGEAVALFEPARYGFGEASGAAAPSDVMRAFDYVVPDVITAYGNGSNSITATSYADLPTTPLEVNVMNPHPVRDMLVMVGFGAWLAGNSTTDVRLGVQILSSGISFGSPGSGGTAAGWGEVPASLISTLSSGFATLTYSLPPSQLPYRFIVQAYRSSSVAVPEIRYPTLRVIPLRFL